MKTTNWRLTGALYIFFLLARCAAPVQAQPYPPTNPPAGSPGNYLTSWSFPDTNWFSDAGYAPLSFTNLFLRSVGDGNNALIVDTGGDPAWLTYNVVETSNHTNLTFSAGSISLWFSADWSGTNAGGTGPGTWGRFIEAGTYTTNASIGWFSFYLSPDGCTVYLAGQTNDGNGNVFLAAPVTITNFVWNNFVATYGPTNSAFYFNGALVTNSPYGVAYYPDTNAITNGFSIGSSAVDGQSQVQGMLADIATLDGPMDSNTVFLTYQLYYFSFYGTGLPGATNIPDGQSQPNDIPSFDFFTGPGSLQFVSNTSVCVSNSNIWITNAVGSLGPGTNLTLTFTIAGGFDGVPYDVFASPGLANPIHNSPWSWLGQGYHCKTYTVTVPTNVATYLVLGQPTDTDGDGLTDAFEVLVSKTSPTNANTGGTLPDGWLALNGLTGANGLPTMDPDSDGLNNQQEFNYGTKPLVNEGFAIWVASPAGISGIP